MAIDGAASPQAAARRAIAFDAQMRDAARREIDLPRLQRRAVEGLADGGRAEPVETLGEGVW